MDKIERIKELVELLNKAGKAYYHENEEVMSNFDYDKLYDELKELESQTGMLLSNSPTINVGYEVIGELPKETHQYPMLSLDKTKEVDTLKSFLGKKEGLLSWKLDGLTIVLTYQNGSLTKAVTRGNGQIGEVVTGNAKMFKNLPLTIQYKGELIIRGEAVIKYSDFNLINEKIADIDAKYKNPRNLCSGSVRQLNNKITQERSVNFYAFTLVKAEGVQYDNSIEKQLNWLKEQGFMVVDYQLVNQDNIEDTVNEFAHSIPDHDIPSDGLVLLLEDISYGESLGATSKFPRNSIAFKWADEIKETTLNEIEWSASRTGLINPIAVFEPVELEGTTVTRASLHNISILEALALGKGDTIEVYKANMIIPQIANNLTRSGSIEIPEHCPACEQNTEIKNENNVKTLYCPNQDCTAKRIKLFTHFVSRNAMNIDGLSEETLDKFIKKGFIHEFADLYKISRYKDEIIHMPGFGEKSYHNLIKSLEDSRQVQLYRLIYSLGILNIGLSNAKLISKAYNHDLVRVRNASEEELVQIEGIGSVIANAYVEYFSDPENNRRLDELMKEITIEIESTKSKNEQILDGKVFVITGSLFQFSNRDEAKEKIESLGGKVTGSVTGKTDYLINNDNTSSSSKNKKAKELGVKIITEEELLKIIE